MKVHDWDVFLKQVTEHVRFKYDHFEIRKELQDHLEDLTKELMEEGHSEEEAQRIALESMGDAKEIGEALDKEHSPVLGWIWRLIHWCLIGIVILLVPTMINIVLVTGYTVFDVITAYEILPEEVYGELEFLVEPNVRGKVDDVNIIIDEVRRYGDGTLEVCYRTWINPLARSQKWSFSLGNSFYDEHGEDRFYGGGYSKGGIISHHSACLENFPEDSEVLVINYDYSGRKFYAEIPLTEEAGGLSLAD